MTVIIEDYMRRDMHLSGAELFVYAALVGHLEHGFSTVTQDQLADELGLGLRTVNRAVSQLKAKRAIQVRPFVDNGKHRNAIMMPKDLNIKMKNDNRAQDFIEIWNSNLELNESLTIDDYKMLQKTLAKYTIYEVIQAVKRYATILTDKSYYKSHLYKISEFLNRIERYFLDGSEWKEYQMDYKKKHHNRFTESDRPFNEADYEASLIPEDQLGKGEM